MMPLKGAKKRSYNKKYYFENKDIISTRKKEAYHEDLDKIVKNLLHVVRQITTNTQIVAPSRLGKLDTQWHSDSGAKSTARSMVNYDRDPDSGAKSTARSKASYNRNPESGTK